VLDVVCPYRPALSDFGGIPSHPCNDDDRLGSKLVNEINLTLLSGDALVICFFTLSFTVVEYLSLSTHKNLLYS
jgi:hypothetical protein